MSNSISGNVWMRGMMHRPDPTQMANRLFSRGDTKNQGHMERSDLQSAFSQIASASQGSGGSSVTADEVFSQLDGDSDGNVTKDEMSSAIKNLTDELDSQYNQMRMQGYGAQEDSQIQVQIQVQVQVQSHDNRPPPSENEAGFTKDELSSQLKKINAAGSFYSQRAGLVSNVVNHFEAADADSSGKITFKEAQAYNQSNPSSASDSVAESTSNTQTGNSNAAITEIASAFKKLADELSSQVQGAGNRPPPPPENDNGFTKDELSSQLEEINASDSSDSERASRISNVVNNFEAADADSDGKVTSREAQAYDQSSQSSTSGSTSESTSSPQIGNSNAAITEIASAFKKLADELSSQVQGAGHRPPPRPKNDTGFTKDELSSQLEAINSAASSASERASLISNVVNNFEAADADSDGKMTFKEAQAFNQSSQSSASDAVAESNSTQAENSAADSSSDDSNDTTQSVNSEAAIMHKIMELVQAYGRSDQDASQTLSSLSNLISTSA